MPKDFIIFPEISIVLAPRIECFNSLKLNNLKINAEIPSKFLNELI